jgi:hypothetical protein
MIKVFISVFIDAHKISYYSIYDFDYLVYV